MKKIYVKPAVEIATTHFEDYLMAGSSAPGQASSSDGQSETPTDNSGGGGFSPDNSKKFNMWDSWEED